MITIIFSEIYNNQIISNIYNPSLEYYLYYIDPYLLGTYIIYGNNYVGYILQFFYSI